MSGAICAWCLGEIEADPFALDGGAAARRHIRECPMLATRRARAVAHYLGSFEVES